MSIEFFARHRSGFLVKPRFEVMKFPGGEVHVKWHDSEVDYTEHYAVIRGANIDDYIATAMWGNIIYNETDLLTKDLHVFVPYLPGARADHDSTDGYQVYAHLFDTFAGRSLHFLDPHSPVMPDAIYRGVELDFAPIAVRAVAGRSGLSPYVGVIAPDKGAVDRAQRVADLLQVPVYYATKERDPDTGKLSKFQSPAIWEGMRLMGDLNQGRFLIVDDICDGGGTFMGLASVLGIPRERLDLWVTHGVFSGNAAQLVEAYGNIYTTDSHPGARNEAVGAKVTPLLPWWLEELRK